jgi:hypothetical protein
MGREGIFFRGIVIFIEEQLLGQDIASIRSISAHYKRYGLKATNTMQIRECANREHTV